MNNVKILQGDCIESMKGMEAGSVNCCVTSPPYFGLRDYGTATWKGGDPKCDHIEKHFKHGGERADRNQDNQKFSYKGFCEKCGAISVDEQIGLEETPDAYVAKMVEVFREVKRVLRDDGTVWLNLGDSYCGYTSETPSKRDDSPIAAGTVESQENRAGRGDRTRAMMNGGIKPKDLIGIPWRIAFALQADGWYLRQDIIWHKPNPMPESVTDRCTKSHEYIFLLSKSKKYYYDHEAIKEPHTTEVPKKKRDKSKEGYGKAFLSPLGKGERTGYGENGRNKRSVWTVNTKPYKGAHFATFPEKLILPCILAGCPKGGVVLDPFGGSGTTAEVARKQGRGAVLCELNGEYIPLIKKRLEQQLLF